MLSIQENPRGVVFKVLIQPRSSKNTLAGLHDDALKVKLTAPPVNNAANRMRQMLDELLELSRIGRKSNPGPLTSGTPMFPLRYKFIMHHACTQK